MFEARENSYRSLVPKVTPGLSNSIEFYTKAFDTRGDQLIFYMGQPKVRIVFVSCGSFFSLCSLDKLEQLKIQLQPSITENDKQYWKFTYEE